MKKFLLGLGVSLFVVLIVFIVRFWYDNLFGIGPVIKEVSKDITEVINTTDMPLNVPAGFEISVFAKGLLRPRVLEFDPNGVLLTSITKEGRVVALPDKNMDGEADEVVVVARGLNLPHGLAIHCEDKECQLFIAETNVVAAYDYDEEKLRAVNRKKIINLPSGGNHFTRTILISEIDGEKKLLISIGSTCNVCVEQDWRRTKVLVSNLDGSELEVFSKGLRNAVFLESHPETGEIWVTEMGRDLLGEDIPADEINILAHGADFGWPYCYGANIHDDDFDSTFQVNCDDKVQSHIDIQAHSAPLGLAFVPDSWPVKYQNDLLVAYHGSWNRTVPTGYKIMRIGLDKNGVYEEREDLITGWLTDDNESLGRPVDVAFDEMGVLYISDDKAGVIYRVKVLKQFTSEG